MYKRQRTVTNKRVKITPIKGGGIKIPPKRIKGFDMFAEPYANIFLSAKKKSGKTTLIHNIIKACKGRDIKGKPTKVIAFVSTLNKDDNWKAIAKMVGKKNFTGYTSLYDENGDSRLRAIIEDALEEDSETTSGGSLQPAECKVKRGGNARDGIPDLFSNLTTSALRNKTGIAIPVGLVTDNIYNTDIARRMFSGLITSERTLTPGDANTEEARDTEGFKQRRIAGLKSTAEQKAADAKHTGGGVRGKIAPSYIFIFDDLAGEIKDPFFTHLVKKNRHFRSKILVSSQNFKDIKKEARAQMEFLILFRGLSKSRLQEIHEEMANFVPLDFFITAYKDATSDQFGFLKVDRVDDVLSSGFNFDYSLK